MFNPKNYKAMDIVKKQTNNNGHGAQRERDLSFFPSPFNSLFENVFSTEGMVSRVPSVNVYETDHEVVLEFSAPGYKKDDIKIELEKDLLSISGEIKNEQTDEKRSYSRREFQMSSFKRSFTIPEIVDTDKINASYEDGLLKVSMPKRDEAKPKPPRTIQIS
jgi:HSP20 family protein